MIQEKPRIRVPAARRGVAVRSGTLHAVGTPPGGSYSWAISDGSTVRLVGSGATADARGLQVGVTTATVTYTRDGMTATDTTQVQVIAQVDPIITPDTQTVLAKKSTAQVTRKMFTLRTSEAFDGTGTFTWPAASLRFFTADTGGTEIAHNGTDNVFPGARLTAGVNVWVEGVRGSAALRDLQLTLTLAGGTKAIGPPAHATVTCVELTLDICMSRTAAGVDPAVISAADKNAQGRYVHVQDTGNHHGRAMLIVRKARPEAFVGDLRLAPVDAKVQLFQNETGGAAMATPHTIANATIGAAGVKLWAQGATVSGALHDTGFRLGVQGLGDEGDRASITVVRFRRLQAIIHATRPNWRRLNNWPAAHRTHTLRRGTVDAMDPTNYDEDYTTNPPLVLIEDSVRADLPVELSVQVEPAGVPVSWDVPGDNRPAPDGDAAAIVALAPGGPNITTPIEGDRLRATLLADGVGSFHIAPYVDCNGNSQLDLNDEAGARIDREPYIFMNLVLIRVQGFSNLSLANSRAGTPGIVMDAGGPVEVVTGDFKGRGNDAVTMRVIARVIGGGHDGMRGLNPARIFAGWVNNERNCPTSPGPSHWGEDVTHSFQAPSPAPPPPPAAPPPPPPVKRTRCFWRGGGVEISGPMLDSGYIAQGTGGNSCTGTARHNGSTVVKRPDPTGIGERWDVLNPDSPSSGTILRVHPTDAAARLRNFKFNIDFRCDLVFWTNASGIAGPSNVPASRLYSTVQTNTWRIRLESNFVGAALTEHVVHARRVTFTKDPAPTRRARPVHGSGLETRLPDGLNSLQANVPF
ncbi:MAG TPA: hypothetical protein VM285_04930 [Polyangia bacterium]|nr:hypothetical protein [Polyangia bacterium]